MTQFLIYKVDGYRTYFNLQGITDKSTVKLLEKSRGNMNLFGDGGNFSTSFAATVVKKLLKMFAMSFKL